eukprot:scaffold111_cov142-Skeletonema_menzelii.AAC.7
MNANNSSTNPKRVAGGIVLGGKKKKKKRKIAAAGGASTSSNNSSVPSILKSVPPRIANHSEDDGISSPPKAADASNDDEFDELLINNDDEIPSDVLLCLQSCTQSSSGMTAEACAYCPIFATNNDGEGQTSSNKKVCTHLAPFLPKSVILHILDTDSSSASSRMQTEQDIKSLASKNKVRLLQLHGTAITTTTAATPSSSFRDSKVASAKFSNTGVTGLRGDGNDDDDIAVMEILAYETAVKMAIRSHTATLRQEEQQSFDGNAISNWFLQQLVPYYAGKTWISSSNLNSFVQSYRVKEYWSVDRMTKVIHELTLAGLFLPRRGLGVSGMEGYWFSLPGLGSTSKSIADGRVAILRKLRSCKYQEKKRSILEREHGQFKDGSDSTLADDSWAASKKKTCIQQSGRFLVLDLLAKGLVVLKKTSSGEHFISLPK